MIQYEKVQLIEPGSAGLRHHASPPRWTPVAASCLRVETPASGTRHLNGAYAGSALRLPKFGFLGRQLACLLLILPPAVAPLFAQATAAGVSMRLLARETGKGAGNAPQPVAAGDVLGSNHEVQIRIRVKRDAYVYVIAYSSGSRSARLLHPV